MRAMVLAAGLGKRMRPLTDHSPKPLLLAGGKSLIEYQLEKLANAGFKEVLVNTHWCHEQIPDALGDGSKWGLSLSYSYEPELLETAGGIRKVLDWLCEQDDCFFLINGDIYCEIASSFIQSNNPKLSSTRPAEIGLVENPEHNKSGDFGFDKLDQLVRPLGNHNEAYTYAGVAWFHKSFFNKLKQGPAPLGPMLKNACLEDKVSGFIINDYWLDVGTPERLAELNSRLKD